MAQITDQNQPVSHRLPLTCAPCIWAGRRAGEGDLCRGRAGDTSRVRAGGPAIPRIWTSYYVGAFRPGISRVNIPARHLRSRAWRSRHYRLWGGVRASPRDHPRQGEPGHVWPGDGCRVPGRPGGSTIETEDRLSAPAPASRCAPARGAQGAARCPAPKARVRCRAAGAAGGSLRLRQDQPARGMGHDDGRAGCLAVLR